MPYKIHEVNSNAQAPHFRSEHLPTLSRLESTSNGAARARTTAIAAALIVGFFSAMGGCWYGAETTFDAVGRPEPKRKVHLRYRDAHGYCLTDGKSYGYETRYACDSTLTGIQVHAQALNVEIVVGE